MKDRQKLFKQKSYFEIDKKIGGDEFERKVETKLTNNSRSVRNGKKVLEFGWLDQTGQSRW